MRLHERSPLLIVDARTEGSRTVLALSGELDGHTGADLSQRCRAHLSGDEPEVVFALADLDFADVGGVCALAAVAREVLDEGVLVGLRDPSPLVCRVLALTSVAHLAAAPQYA